MDRHSAPGIGDRPADIVCPPPASQGEPDPVRDAYDALADKSGGKRT